MEGYSISCGIFYGLCFNLSDVSCQDYFNTKSNKKVTQKRSLYVINEYFSSLFFRQNPWAEPLSAKTLGAILFFVFVICIIFFCLWLTASTSAKHQSTKALRQQVW